MKNNAPDEKEFETRLDSLKHLGEYATGDFFPLRQKKIKKLIGASEDYIVFLDEADDVEWSQNEMDQHEKHGMLIARMTDLQELSATLIPKKMLLDLRHQLGTGLARSFEGDVEGAEKALSAAEDRLKERIRSLYVFGGLAGSGLAALLLGIVAWVMRGCLGKTTEDLKFTILISAGAGAIGALVSVLLKKQLPLVSAQPSLYFFDGALRILLGALAGFVAGLAIKANILLGFIGTKDPYVFALACCLAGVAERFVPNLVETHS